MSRTWSASCLPRRLVRYSLGDGGYVDTPVRRYAKFASNNRAAGPPEENKAVVQGSIFYFGRFSVNDADKTSTTQVEGCSFPNWVGIERKSTYAINGDELISTSSGSSVGEGTVRVVYKRAK